MRIRRYAARLLASSNPANSSAPPRPDEAPWLHAAADDCAFCQLTRGADPQVAPDAVKRKGHAHIAAPEPEPPELLKTHDLAPRRPPLPEAQRREVDDEGSAREDTGEAAASPESQVDPDGVKRKGHIAGPEPQGELKSDERAVDLPQPPRAPEEEPIPAQGCQIGHQHSAREDAAARLECTDETIVDGEVATEPAVEGAAFVVGEVTDEQEVAGIAPLVNCSVIEPEVTGGVPLASGSTAGTQVIRGASLADEAVTEDSEGASLGSRSIAELEVIMGASLADKAVAEQQVSEGVSLASGSIAEPEVIVGASFADEAVAEREAYEGVSLESGSIAEPQVTMGAPLADEAVAEQEIFGAFSLVSEATTEAAGVVTALGVTTGAPLDTEGIAEPDIKMGASPVDESVAEIDKMEASSVSEAAAEMDKMEAAASVNESAAEMDKMEASYVNESAAEMDKMEASSVNESAAEMDKMEAASANESAAEMDKMEASSVNVSAAEMDKMEAVSANGSAAEMDKMEAASANESAAEMDKMEASSLNESAAEMDVIPLCSFVIEVATDSGLERIYFPYEAATEQEVSEGVSPASEAATEPTDVVTAVTTGTPLDGGGVADTDMEMGPSSVNESAAEMDFTPLCSLIETSAHPGLPERVPLAIENATDRVLSEGVILVMETATKSLDVVTASGVTTGAPIDNQGIAEPDIKMEDHPANESSAEMDVMRLDSPVIEAAADPEHSARVSVANKTITEQEVPEGVSLVSEAATEPADVVTALEVTTGAPLDNAGAAEPETKMGASLVNESTTEMDCVRLGSPAIEASTHPGLAETVSLVSEVVTETGAANLDTEFSVEAEATGGPSLLNESTELEIPGGVSIAKEAAAEPKVTGEASVCSEDCDAALIETRPLDCDLDCATVQVENAGVSVANEMQPSRDDAADELVSVSSTGTGPDKSPTADEVTPHDDTPSVSCVSGIVARSVGKSGRTDIICYARRRGKRKLDMAEMETEQNEMGDGDIYDQCEEKVTLDRTAPCESAMSTAGSAEIKLADIKKDLADNSASSKCKRRKGRYECDIDYCRMTFKKKAELSVHKKNMCTVKSCGKHFRSHKYLRRHQSIHNEDTPYKCPWEDCSMAFKWTWALADHFQVHTGEKPYRCRSPGCSKIYKYVSDFIRHKKRCKPQRCECTSWTQIFPWMKAEGLPVTRTSRSQQPWDQQLGWTSYFLF